VKFALFASLALVFLPAAPLLSSVVIASFAYDALKARA